MTLSPEQFRAHLVDYLYGELSGEALRAFEASLLASESYRRELESMERTLHLSRAALHGPLASEPPTRDRSALLAAATAAAATRALQSAEDRAHARAATDESGGLWAWLRRPFLLPALGAVATCALLLLVLVREPDASGTTSHAPPSPSLPESSSAPAAAPAAPTATAEARSGEETSSRGAPPTAAAPRAARATSAAAAPRPRVRPPEHEVGEGASAPLSSAAADEAASRKAPSATYAAPASRPQSAPQAAAERAEVVREGAELDAARDLDEPVGRDQLVVRARTYEAAGQHVEAARTYRALLRRFPDDRARAAWREALARVERALERARRGAD